MNVARSGSRPVVVLQHGFLSGSGYWGPLVAELAGRFDVLAFDLPGFAGRGDQPVPDSMAGFAADLVARLDELSVRRFSLVGHSLGGMVAQQAALDFPDRIDRLVLYGSAADGHGRGRFETLEQTVTRFRQEGLESTADRIVETWFAKGRESPHFELCRASGMGVTLDAAIKTLRTSAGWDIQARLQELTMPTLVICGDGDRSTPPDQSVLLWRGIPGAQLCVLPGCAHNAHLESVGLFATILADFLLAPDAAASTASPWEEGIQVGELRNSGDPLQQQGDRERPRFVSCPARDLESNRKRSAESA